jgi:hypothetical protein
MYRHSYVNDPAHWHDRAETMRLLAETIIDFAAKAAVLDAAAGYDKLAQRAEERMRKSAAPAHCSTDSQHAHPG